MLNMPPVSNFTARWIILLAFCPVTLVSSQGFVDVSALAGITAVHDGNLHPDTLHIGSGGGWIDANTDGFPDLYSTRRLSGNLLYINNGNGGFTESAASYGVQNAIGDGSGISVADYNNDGYADLFLINNNANRLFKNNGNGTFTDVTIVAGFDTTENSRSTSAAWGDYNKDGYLDLYVTNHVPVAGYGGGSTADKLYKNNGNGTFSDVSILVDDTGILTGSGTNVIWTDFDNDRDLDLVVINDCTTGNAVGNQFYRNDGNTHPTLSWKFTEIGVAAGLGQCKPSFGVSSGDFNRDGWQDLFISGQSQCYLMKNNGGVNFVDVTASWQLDGLPANTNGWATLLADINLDGWQDIVMAMGSYNNTGASDPESNVVFMNSGLGSFINQGVAQNLADNGKTRNIFYGDYDLDGDPDMVIIGYGEPVILKKNENHNGYHYIAVKLKGTASNRDCIGAKLKLTLPNGEIQYFEVSGRTGFGGVSSTVAYFGIGNQPKGTTLEVTWPTVFVQTFKNIPADRIVELVEPSTLTTTVSYANVALASGIDGMCGACNPGGGVSFADFNGDGWDDLTFCTQAGDSVKFYQNNQNGTFTKLPSLVSNVAFQRSVTWVDYDNDGDKDLYLSNGNDLGENQGVGSKNKLYQNNGNLVLTDVTLAAGLPNIEDPSYSAHFGDVNNDGWLDIYVLNWPLVNILHTSYLYLNNGNGTFTNATTAWHCTNSGNGMAPGYPGLAAAFLDINEDGKQDLFISNDRVFFPNVLYKNVGNDFANISISAGINDSINAMSATVGDYDNDGDFDVYVTNAGQFMPDSVGANIMYRNNGNETFTDVAVDIGVPFYKYGWGANFLDCDLDLDLDLYVCAQYLHPPNKNLLYLNQYPLDTFFIANVQGMVGDTVHSFSNAIGDFNNDGLPDIAVNNAEPFAPYPPGADMKFHLWKNQTQTSGRWLKIRLKGTVANREGIGSWIEYHINGQKYIRYAFCGEAYLAQNSTSIFFGAGSNLMIDSIKVKWLSGNVSRLYNIATNQSLAIDESTVIYVAHDAQGANTGMSWTNAFKTLRAAVDYAKLNTSITQIWVKTGTYYPHPTDRYASFEMRQGLQIFGGFSGTETTLGQRNPVLYPVTLSGDIGLPGMIADNSFHVVTIPSGVTSCILDGVKVRYGNANGPVSTNQVGGGIYSSGYGTLKGVTISDCASATVGAAVYHTGLSKLLVLNAVIMSDNSCPGAVVYTSAGAQLRCQNMNTLGD